MTPTTAERRAARDADNAAALMLRVLVGIGAHLNHMRLINGGRPRERTTCEGCGCLVLPTERCPGCQAQWMRRREAA